MEQTGGTAAINTSGSGTWRASVSDNWILLTSSSGTAGYPVGYAVSANNTVETRIGYVYVSGHTHTITQAGLGAALESYSAKFEREGGSGSVAVVAPAGKTWHAQSNVDWITVSAASGTGSATLAFTVARYDEVSTRSGTLTVADNTFTIRQTGRRMQLKATSATTDYFAGTIKIRVNALADTEWSVSVNRDWMTVTDTGNGIGGDEVKVAIAENLSYNSRSGTVTIGTETFAVAQLGRTSLVFRINPTEVAEFDVDGASGERIAITATPDLGWTASRSAEWIELSSGFSSGTGNGNVVYKVKPNPTLYPRSGAITVTAADGGVAAKRLEISQAAAVASLTVDGYEFEAAGESLAVGVNTGNIVGWNVINNTDWISISGLPTAGPANITLTASANTSVQPRSGTLTIADHLFRVSQKGRGVAISYDETKVFDTDGKTTGENVDNVISVIADADVAWTAVASDPTWIVIYEGLSGRGNGTVKFIVAPYVGSGEIRTGMITIGDQVAYVTQRPYELSIEPNGQWVDGNAGAGEIQVALDIAGVWNAIATEPWITVVSGYDSGTGSGKVLFSYTDNNTGKQRTGKIVINGEIYTLTQAARQNISVSASVEGHGGHVSGGGIYTLGSDVTLVAIPDDGYEFRSWMLPDGTVVSTEAMIQTTATASEYLALFTALAPDIESVESSSSGTRLNWRNLAWASQFHVWRGTSPDRNQTEKIATIANDGTCQYFDGSGVEDQDYWYWIEAEGMDEDVFGSAARGWRGKERFAITYDNLRGTTHANPASFTKDDAFLFTPPSPRVGYTFTGWTPSGIVAGTASELTVRANWHQNEYAVHFDANGGTGSMEDEAFTYGLWKYLTSNNFTRVGYAFAGWTTGGSPSSATVYADGESTKNLTAEPNGIVTLYAQWVPDTYTVTFDRQSGSGGTASVTATYGSTMPAITPPTRTGYTFGGYYTAENGGGTQYYTAGGVSAHEWDMTAATTLYAKWTGNTYAVTFDRQGGSGGTASVTATYGSAMPSITIPTRPGYTFGGYWTQGGGAGAGNGLSVRYYDISSIGFNTQTRSDYDTWTQSEAALTNYFASWTPTLEANTIDWGETLQSGFQWNSAASYYFSEFPGLWLDYASTNRYHGKYANPSQNHFAMSLEGFLFIDVEGTYSFGASCDDYIVIYIDGIRVCATGYWESPSKGTIPLAAGFHRIRMATYEDEGEQGMFVSWKKPGDSSYSPLPQSILSTGVQYYTASGASAHNWDKTSTTMLYARWTANTYSVTLNRQNGSGGTSSVTATYGSAMPSIMVPTRTGYTFGGYYTAANGSGTQYYTASGASTRNWNKTTATTLYAKWIANTYSVTLDRQGGSGGTASVTATYGSAMPAITPPTWANLRFKGYFTGANGTGTQYYTAFGASARSWDKASNTTLYALWRENQKPSTQAISPNVDFIAMEIGATETFSITAEDPDGDNLSVIWYVCDKSNGTYTVVQRGGSFIFTPSIAGNFRVKAEVSDGTASVATCWDVKVFPADVSDYDELPGSGLVWSVTGTTLTISGNGPMPDYAGAEPPYQAYAGTITKIVVEEGITHVGDNAFQDFQNVTLVSLPETLTSIGIGAFADCASLDNIAIPNSVTALGDGIFSGCDSLENLYLPAPFLDDDILDRLEVPNGSNVINSDIHAFVKRLYLLCLGRNPDMAGINDWSTQLASGANDGANVAFGFFMSREMTNRNLSNGDFVETLYNVMMGRASDAGGKAGWVSALESGVTRMGVLRGFAESAEFTRICGDYGIVRGSVNPAYLESRDQNYGITKFVARCYTKALGRAYDAEGLNYWCSQILSSPNPKATAIYVSTTGFFDSQEFQNRRLGNGAFVDVLYETFLGRAADAGGRADWVSQLNAGADRRNVMAGFYNSAEFNAIMASYGIH